MVLLCSITMVIPIVAAPLVVTGKMKTQADRLVGGIGLETVVVVTEMHTAEGTRTDMGALRVDVVIGVMIETKDAIGTMIEMIVAIDTKTIQRRGERRRDDRDDRKDRSSRHGDEKHDRHRHDDRHRHEDRHDRHRSPDRHDDRHRDRRR